MQIVFGSVKYLFKNIWYVLPYAILPAVFLALILDFPSVSTVVTAFFTGNPPSDFLLIFRSLSLLRIDLLGGIYTALGFICFAAFLTMMLCVTEKHLRLGKRTLSGAFSHFGSLLGVILMIAFVFFLLYEVWAIALSAVLFAISAIGNSVVVCILFALVFLLFALALVYLITVFYLWIPCKQMTGFGTYNAFLYSYRLMTGIRGKLYLSLLLSFFAVAAIITGMALLPELYFRIVVFFLFVFAFLNFGIRMETAYFSADKIDREDIIRSYREL